MSTAVFDTVPRLAPMVADTSAVTAVVAIAKSTLDAPAGIVTDAGTEACTELDERVTITPPDGAFPVSDTVPVAEAPPTTNVGKTFTASKTGGFIVTVSRTVVPLQRA